MISRTTAAGKSKHGGVLMPRRACFSRRHLITSNISLLIIEYDISLVQNAVANLSGSQLMDLLKALLLSVPVIFIVVGALLSLLGMADGQIPVGTPQPQIS